MARTGVRKDTKGYQGEWRETWELLCGWKDLQCAAGRGGVHLKTWLRRSNTLHSGMGHQELQLVMGVFGIGTKVTAKCKQTNTQKVGCRRSTEKQQWGHKVGGKKAIIMTAKNYATDNTENQAVDARWLWACTVINQEEDCFREM